MVAPGPAALRTVSGPCVLVANPCTTVPCLPGMAWAVRTDGGELLFITVAGRWSDQAPVVGGGPLQAGDAITLTGRVGRLVDALGQPFSVIELGPAISGRRPTCP